jgi:hypothetical protein
MNNGSLYGWYADEYEQGNGLLYNSRWGANTQVIELDVNQN